MGLKIYWTDFAKAALRDIFDYYKDKAGLRLSQRLIEGLIQSTEILVDQPYSGSKEELLSNRNEGFRYLVFKNYKIIYWVNQVNQRIEIVDVFDTRQNPLKIIKY